MTLRNRQDHADAAWDWSCLDGCFGNTRIAACDIDGAVEVRGNFLFIEAKPPRGNLTTGQEIMLRRLAKLPGVTVLILWGLDGAPVRCAIMRGATYRVQRCSLRSVRVWIGRWYAAALAAPAPLMFETASGTEGKAQCPTTRTTTTT